MASAAASPLASLRSSPRPPASVLPSPSSSSLIFSSLDSRSPRSGLRLLRGRGILPPWSGLTQLGLSARHFLVQREKRGRWRGKAVFASLFGVGAPEALVIGVVALLVFGPKGLAEVARNLGKTLRAFQPTIRELQEVSREFKSTLEREIGLDEVVSPTNYKSTGYMTNSQQALVDPNGKPTKGPHTSEELPKVPQEQLAASAPDSQTEASTLMEQQEPSPNSEVIMAASPEASSPNSEVILAASPEATGNTASENPNQIQTSEKPQDQTII